MKMRQLEAFRAIILHRTVTRASEMLHISQPATTRLLADLELSLGFKLFDQIESYKPVNGRVKDLDLWEVFEQKKQLLAGKLLVVRNKRRDTARTALQHRMLVYLRLGV